MAAIKKTPGPPVLSFQKGINTFQQNRLSLDVGECATMLNADLSKIGQVGIIQSDTSFLAGLTGRVHSLYKTGDNLFVGHGTAMSHIDVSVSPAAATAISATFDGSDLHMFSYENFLYVTDGTTPKKVYIPTLAVTAWGFDNPLTAPSGVAGSGGNPDGTYDLYYTYVAKYPDGTEYESDISPIGQVAVSLSKIEWTYPASAPDTQITHIRLYRDKTGVTATVDQVRQAVEDRQTELEVQTGKKKFSSILQEIIRRQTNRRVVANLGADQTTFVGPFYVDEVEIGEIGYTDNVSDDNIVVNIPFSRERYNPLFGS